MRRHKMELSAGLSKHKPGAAGIVKPETTEFWEIIFYRDFYELLTLILDGPLIA